MAWVVAVVLIALVAVGWYLVEQPRRRDFWRLAARHPDNAYDWFVSHEAWIVVDPASGRSTKPDEARYTSRSSCGSRNWAGGRY